MMFTQNVFLIIVSRIGGKFGAESAKHEHIARAQQFASAKKMRRSDQISRTY